MKNPNGFGCVYKYNTKFKKLRKPWIAKVSVNRIGERQKQKVIGYYATKAEAYEALFAYQKDPSMLDNSKITVNDVFDMYYKEQETKVSESRLKNIKSQYNNFKPLGNKKIVNLTPVMLQDFINNIEKSSATKLACKSLLKGIYKQAMKMQIITEDYTDLIEIGKHEKVLERVIFSSEEIQYLWENADNFVAQQLLILIYSGMRINEYLSLNLEDYDLEEHTVRTGSKTEAGRNRLIPIHSRVRYFLLDILKQGKNKVVYTTFTYHMNRFIKASKGKLQKHRVHDTRHTFASLLNTLGANEVAITKIIGHSDIATTNKIYTHKDIEELKNTVELLN